MRWAQSGNTADSIHRVTGGCITVVAITSTASPVHPCTNLHGNKYGMLMAAVLPLQLRTLPLHDDRLPPTPQSCRSHLNESTPDLPSVSENASSSKGNADASPSTPDAAGALMLGAARYDGCLEGVVGQAHDEGGRVKSVYGTVSNTEATLAQQQQCCC